MSKFREDKVCILCGDNFFPLNTKIKRCIDCHSIYKAGDEKEIINTIYIYLMPLLIKTFAYFSYSRWNDDIVDLFRIPDRSNKFHPKVHQKYDWIKHRAKVKGYEFTLTKKHLNDLMVQPCNYCGVFLNKAKSGMSIDRVDNNAGYTDNNTVSACMPCNIRKRNYSLKDFSFS